MDSTENSAAAKKPASELGWYLGAGLLTLVALGWWFYVLVWSRPSGPVAWWTDTHLGTAGDSVAVFTAMLTALALFAAIRSISMQREELGLQREESVRARGEFARQASALEEQLAASQALAKALQAQAAALLEANAEAREASAAQSRAVGLQARASAIQSLAEAARARDEGEPLRDEARKLAEERYSMALVGPAGRHPTAHRDVRTIAEFLRRGEPLTREVLKTLGTDDAAFRALENAGTMKALQRYANLLERVSWAGRLEGEARAVLDASTMLSRTASLDAGGNEPSG